jgi:hypothetical protein
MPCIHDVPLNQHCGACNPHVPARFAFAERVQPPVPAAPLITLPPASGDDHAYIHDMMGDASVLSDRMDYDPTALAGIVGRLVNSISILSDQNKALAARVAELETWQHAEETAALEASERE